MRYRTTMLAPNSIAKLLILHLSNAVELLMKDLLLDTGRSIYKNPKETLSLGQCLGALTEEGVEIPYRNKIELLVDERNALQHRFGSPNELSAIFYMDITERFFAEIFAKHYDVEFDETLEDFVDPKELHAFRMRTPSDDGELEELRKLARVHPLGAVLSAGAYLEKIIHRFADEVGLQSSVGPRVGGFTSHRYLTRFGLQLPEGLEARLTDFTRVRAMAAHGRGDPSYDDVDRAVPAIEEFEQFLKTVEKDAFIQMVQDYYEERNRRHRPVANAATRVISSATAKIVSSEEEDDGANSAPSN